MNKQEFLAQLEKGLSGLPQRDLEERLAFYSEMIDDRMEEGLSEEEAVSEIGNVDEIVSQIVADTPLTTLVKEKMTQKKSFRLWEILLLVFGSPIWLSLLIALCSVIFSLYTALWSVIISFWAVFVSLAACAIGITAAGTLIAIGGKGLTGAAMIAAAMICGGLSIFLYFGCKLATKGTLLLTKKVALWIKNRFIAKEAVL